MAQLIRLNLIRFQTALIVACLTLVFESPATADIYMRVDENGVMHFTNAPTTSNFQIYIKDREKRRKTRIDTNRFDPYIDEAATLNGVAFPLIKAVIRAESAFNPEAVSKKGALGLMQIMPFNLDAFQVYDPFDPWQNIMGGARYLKALLQRFNGQVPLALAAYNAGPEAVDTYRGIPPFQETEEYVKKVMTFFDMYRN